MIGSLAPNGRQPSKSPLSHHSNRSLLTKRRHLFLWVTSKARDEIKQHCFPCRPPLPPSLFLAFLPEGYFGLGSAGKTTNRPPGRQRKEQGNIKETAPAHPPPARAPPTPKPPPASIAAPPKTLKDSSKNN